MPGDFDESEPTAYEKRVAGSVATDLADAHERLRHFRAYAKGEQYINVGLQSRHIEALLSDPQPHRFSEPI